MNGMEGNQDRITREYYPFWHKTYKMYNVQDFAIR